MGFPCEQLEPVGFITRDDPPHLGMPRTPASAPLSPMLQLLRLGSSSGQVANVVGVGTPWEFEILHHVDQTILDANDLHILAVPMCYGRALLDLHIVPVAIQIVDEIALSAVSLWQSEPCPKLHRVIVQLFQVGWNLDSFDRHSLS